MNLIASEIDMLPGTCCVRAYALSMLFSRALHSYTHRAVLKRRATVQVPLEQLKRDARDRKGLITGMQQFTKSVSKLASAPISKEDAISALLKLQEDLQKQKAEVRYHEEPSKLSLSALGPHAAGPASMYAHRGRACTSTVTGCSNEVLYSPPRDLSLAA